MPKLSFARTLPLLMIWTNSYERLTWTPILVLIALQIESPQALAFAASAYSAANLAGNILMGAASDRLGRFRIAGLSLLLLALTTLIHLKVWSAAALVLIRFAHGFFAAAVTPTSLAAVSDGAAPGRRGQSMAQVGLMIAIASIMASPISGRLVESMGVTVTLVIQAAILVLVGVAGLLARPEGAPREPARPREAVPEASAVSGSLSNPGEKDGVDRRVTAFACIVGFAVLFGQNILFYALPLKAAEGQLGAAAIGGLFGVFSVGAAVAFMPPLSRLADRYGRLRPVIIGSIVSATGMSLLGRGVTELNLALMSAGLFIYGLGFGLTFPAVSAAAADGAESSRRGFAFGLLTASFSVGAILGPLVAESLAHVVSPFVTGALVMVAGLSAVALTRHSPALQRAATRA